jgi:diaminopimelate decarboxylase
MHMPRDFFKRLTAALPKIIEAIPSPFHVYDEKGIRGTARQLKKDFSEFPGYRNFFAVKALPNPSVMKIMLEEDGGFDCSSTPELVLSRALGASDDRIICTSNNTTDAEYQAAVQGTPEYLWQNGILRREERGLITGSCILNLDDRTYVEKAIKALGGKLPDLVCFRYNPGQRRKGVNAIIGDPVDQKYGVPHEQIVEAFKIAREYGATRFALHCMIASNQRDYRYILATVKMLLAVARLVGKELGIQIEFINIGGGAGIPYKPNQGVFNMKALAIGARAAFDEFWKSEGYEPRLYSEFGRYVTGPQGVLVMRIINKVMKYKLYYGVDAASSACPRPFIYGAYHGLIVPRLEGKHVQPVMANFSDSLCENGSQFVRDRLVMPAEEGDYVYLENTGAHSWAMGSNYNARLRVAEVLLRENGTAELIRRAETMDDYFSTLNFEPIAVQL